jgi:hypothetical protein
MIGTHPRHGTQEIEDTIHNLGVAARMALEGISANNGELRKAAPIDMQKYDEVRPDAARASR